MKLAHLALCALGLSWVGGATHSPDPLARAAPRATPAFDGFDDPALAAVDETGADWALKVVFFNVGNADAALVLARNGDAAVIDTGRWSSAGNLIADFLEDGATNGVGALSTVDLLYTSHYDADHIGGTEQLVQHRGIRVRKALDPGPNAYRDAQAIGTSVTVYEHYVEGVGDPDWSYAQGPDEPDFVRHRIDHGHVERIGATDAIEIRCVSVRGDTEGDAFDDPQDVAGTLSLNENPGSVALLVRFGDFELYTAGDQTTGEWVGEPDIEGRLVDAGALPGGPDVDVAKVNHHGSDTSSGTKLVQALDAEVAVCCADFNSRYKHPKKVVLKTFEDNDCYVLITGDGKDPNTDDYSDSSHAADDGYDADADAIRNAVGQVVVTVHESGTRYTVRAEGVEMTFSAVDADNARP